MSPISAQDNEQKKTELLDELKKIQEPLLFKPEKHSDTEDDDYISMLLEKIPFINELLQRVNTTTRRVGQLESNHRHRNNTALEVVLFTSNAGLALDILDFLTIPLIYIAAFTLGKKIPFTLKNNAKWLYASIVLALTITALILTPAAPFIAVALASLSLAVSLGSLGMVFYQRAQDRKAIVELIEQIENDTRALNALQDKTKALEEQLNNCHSDNLDTLIAQIDLIKTDYELKTAEIQGLYNEKNKLEERVTSESRIISRCMNVALGSLVVIGSVVSLFFPPAGLSILAIAAIIGGVYVAAPFVVTFGKWLFSRKEATLNNDESPQPSQDLAQASTPKIVCNLSSPDTLKPNSSVNKKNSPTPSVTPTPDNQHPSIKTNEEKVVGVDNITHQFKAKKPKRPDDPNDLTPNTHN